MEVVAVYSEYLTQEEYDRIVNTDEYWDSTDTPPHCNATVFHLPGICAYCDGYYRRHPNFRPAEYSRRDFNGWGGNAAPVVDDEKARAEDAEWAKVWDQWPETRGEMYVPPSSQRANWWNTFLNWILR